MLKEKIDLVVEDNDGVSKKLNSILNASNLELKKRYNIDIKKIHEQFTQEVGEK